jgi:hypothetical protein
MKPRTAGSVRRRGKWRTAFEACESPKLLLATVSLLFTVLLLLGVEYTIGVVAPDPGLVFPPGSTVEYATDEFSSRAVINSLGFRDREFTPRKDARLRVVVIGDSFTFGWGVAQGEAWPKVLERIVPNNEVEIANLGQPGAGAAEYERITARAIPVLHPDLVIVAMLQGDDLRQAIYENTPRPGVRGKLSRVARRWFPHLVRLVRDPSPMGRPRQVGRITAGELRATWERQASQITATLSAEERRRFDGMEEPVRRAFLEGRLNPFLVEAALRDPEYFVAATRPDTSGAVDAGIARVGTHLARLRSLAEGNGASVLAVSVPYGVYTSLEAQQGARRLGFVTEPGMLESDGPDRTIERAAAEAGIPFVCVTESFRAESRAPGRSLYYPLDGHFNVRGHALFARLLLPALERRLSSPLRGSNAAPGARR